MATKEELTEQQKQDKENRERFKESCTKRVTKIVLGIDSLTQYTSDNYVYSKSDVEKIRSTIQKSLDESIKSLSNPSVKKTLTLFED